MEDNISVVILDDEQASIDNLKRQLKTFEFVDLMGEYTDYLEFITFLKAVGDTHVDLVFLDIELGSFNGFEMAEYMKKNFPDSMIIFLTGHDSYAISGYEYQPLDFLSKPVNLLRLDKALQHAREIKFNYKQKKDTRIGIHLNGGYRIIAISEILYIEKVHRKVYIVCKDGEKYVARDSLQKLGIMFAEYRFFRTHQSFLVPMEKIRGVFLDVMKNTYQIELFDVKEKLPLSRDKYQELKKMFCGEGVKFF